MEGLSTRELPQVLINRGKNSERDDTELDLDGEKIDKVKTVEHLNVVVKIID